MRAYEIEDFVNKKLHRTEWIEERNQYIELVDGQWLYEDGCPYTAVEYLFLIDDWEEYKEPVKRKKITMYRYTYSNSKGNYVQEIWCSGQLSLQVQKAKKVVLEETKEVEVIDCE